MIQSRFDADKSTVQGLLSGAVDNPSTLEDGSLASKLAVTQSDLTTLSKQVDQARQIIAAKRTGLDGKGLSATDLKELKSALDRQQQPLDLLASSITSLKSKIDDITSHQIPAWSETYRTYSDVEGAEAAKAKLRKVIGTASN